MKILHIRCHTCKSDKRIVETKDPFRKIKCNYCDEIHDIAFWIHLNHENWPNYPRVNAIRRANG